MRKMPIRSCEATVVRWRWMASEARVITADGNKMLDAQPREIRQHLLGNVPGGALVGLRMRKVLAGEVIGQLLHFSRVGAARVQHGPAATVDGARILAIQDHDVAAPALRIVEIDMRERLPAAT